MIGSDGLRRVAATLRVMRHVEFQLDVARVRRVHHAVNFVGRFAETAHVIVIAERDADIMNALANFGQQMAEPFEIIRRRPPRFRARRIGHLQVQATGVAQEGRLLDLGGDLFGFVKRVAARAAARQRHEL